MIARFGSGALDLLAKAKTAYVQAAVDKAAAAADEENSDWIYADAHLRANILWDECKRLFVKNPAACYQDNLRLLGLNTLSIYGNVYHHKLKQ